MQDGKAWSKSKLVLPQCGHFCFCFLAICLSRNYFEHSRFAHLYNSYSNLIAIVQVLNGTNVEDTEMTDKAVIHLRLSKELRDELEMTATLQRRSMTFVANDLLRAGLDRLNKDVDADMLNLVKMARNIA